MHLLLLPVATKVKKGNKIQWDQMEEKEITHEGRKRKEENKRKKKQKG